MTAPESTSTTDNPTLSAEEIGKRFLRLLEGLKSRDDLSLERTQREMALILSPSLDGRLYGYEEFLADRWRVALNYRLATQSTKIGVDLHFLKDGNQQFDMTPVCPLDFDYYHNALKAMGYRDVPIYGEIGELRSWRYYKDDITLSIIPQNVVAEKAGRLCVKSIGTLN